MNVTAAAVAMMARRASLGMRWSRGTRIAEGTFCFYQVQDRNSDYGNAILIFELNWISEEEKKEKKRELITPV